MKIVERWMIKIVICHVLLLLFFQFIFGQFQVMKDLQRITFYEGVNHQNETPIMETWKKNQ
ncbi:hypothetical protein AN964_09370 [Heyndrickxia shackletonii]|uniref:YpfB family protein n=1 Tax=Heyndrickxia shackletonii TaxID=157838 RepID=A0A0Q3TJE5_9BACI|nr:DUF5359 family protein [Heyndrickxia shackletonii]KQL53689.1 hypothetical protein AN964_09370 [Heyndrickxia shackletonii]MBB2480985.1 DUF5359 family protein [Bacillus sp. APMAM]NEY99826.1 YpfB family protein [Heyndrickxia shackletonii]RTZ55659.1 hypothetical protein EKO25_11375 [Bacillus sp. SAJ1]